MDSAITIRTLAKRWLTLIAAPLAISLAAILLTNLALHQPVPFWLAALAGLVFILAATLYTIAYHQALESLLAHLAASQRARRFSSPKILILDGTLEGSPREIPPTPIHSDRSPTDWRAALGRSGFSVEVGPAEGILAQRRPDVVINPFGELYPESDFLTNATITAIRDYVWAGGVFVSVAGIPFWYRYNPFSRKQETSGRVEGIGGDKFVWIPLFQDLFPLLSPKTEPLEVQATQTPADIERFGDITNEGGSRALTSFRAYPLSPVQLVPILRDHNGQLCVIGAYMHGQGAYLFAGVSITQATPTFEKVVGAIAGWIRYEANKRAP